MFERVNKNTRKDKLQESVKTDKNIQFEVKLNISHYFSALKNLFNPCQARLTTCVLF